MHGWELARARACSIHGLDPSSDLVWRAALLFFATHVQERDSSGGFIGADWGGMTSMGEEDSVRVREWLR